MDGDGEIHEVDFSREGAEVPGEAVSWVVDGSFIGLPVLGLVVGTCDGPEANDIVDVAFKVE